MNDELTQQLIERITWLTRRSEDLLHLEKPPVVARYHTSSGQSIPNTTATIVDYDTLVYDPDVLVITGASWKFTAALAGYYSVAAAIMFDSTTAWADTEYGSLNLYRNNVQFSTLDRKDNYAAANPVYMALAGVDLIHLAVGDYIDIRARQTSGGALALYGGTAMNYVSIWRI